MHCLLCAVSALITLESTALASSSEPVKAVALANDTAVDSNLVARIREFVRVELGITVRAFDAKAPQKKALHELGPYYRGQMATNDLFMVAMVVAGDDVKPHMAIMPESGIAVINVSALSAKDPEKYARRIERQVMRAIAFLLGMPQSPDPRDVTHPYNTIEELDKIGRNFNAPSQSCFEKAAEAARLLPPLETESGQGKLDK
jgi:hypothetical protein